AGRDRDHRHFVRESGVPSRGAGHVAASAGAGGKSTSASFRRKPGRTSPTGNSSFSPSSSTVLPTYAVAVRDSGSMIQMTGTATDRQSLIFALIRRIVSFGEQTSTTRSGGKGQSPRPVGKSASF